MISTGKLLPYLQLHIRLHHATSLVDYFPRTACPCRCAIPFYSIIISLPIVTLSVFICITSPPQGLVYIAIGAVMTF